jgi:hypothetical protein
MILQAKAGTAYVPHPEGIHPAVCVDLIDLGPQKQVWQGQERLVNMLRLVFETEEKLEDGRNATIAKRFTASVHPKSRLAEFLGKWRGKPVVAGETIDLSKLVGACCTLVVSQVTREDGRTYAQIDAVSKPTKKLKASGHYDPQAARERIAKWAEADAAKRPMAVPTPAAVNPDPKAAAPVVKMVIPEPAEDDVPF